MHVPHLEFYPRTGEPLPSGMRSEPVSARLVLALRWECVQEPASVSLSTRLRKGSRLPSRRLRREFCRMKGLSPLSNQCSVLPHARGPATERRQQEAPRKPSSAPVEGLEGSKDRNATTGSTRQEGAVFSLPFKTPAGTHTSKPPPVKQTPIGHHGWNTGPGPTPQRPAAAGTHVPASLRHWTVNKQVATAERALSPQLPQASLSLWQNTIGLP